MPFPEANPPLLQHQLNNQLSLQSRFGIELTNRDWKTKVSRMPYRTTPFVNGGILSSL